LHDGSLRSFLRACPPISRAFVSEVKRIERALSIGFRVKAASETQEHLPEFLRLCKALGGGEGVPFLFFIIHG